MTSKEALKNLELLFFNSSALHFNEETEVIKKDLEKLEKIERVIYILKFAFDFNINLEYKILQTKYVDFLDIKEDDLKILKEVLEDE